MYQEIIAGIFLLVNSYTDLKERSIHRSIWMLALLCSIAGYAAGWCEFSFPELLLSLTPGIFCLTVSFLTREELGYGDSLTVLLTGFMLGLSRICFILWCSFSAAAIWGVGCCLRNKEGRKKELPFLPFFLFGYVLSFFMWRNL